MSASSACVVVSNAISAFDFDFEVYDRFSLNFSNLLSLIVLIKLHVNFCFFALSSFAISGNINSVICTLQLWLHWRFKNIQLSLSKKEVKSYYNKKINSYN